MQFRYCANLVPKSCSPFGQRQRMRKTYCSGDERLARPWRAKAPDDRALQKCKIWGCALSIARDDRWSVINTDPPSLNVMWVLKAAQFPANSSMCVLQFLRWLRHMIWTLVVQVNLFRVPCPPSACLCFLRLKNTRKITPVLQANLSFNSWALV